VKCFEFSFSIWDCESIYPSASNGNKTCQENWICQAIPGEKAFFLGTVSGSEMYSSHKGYSFANHVYLHLHWNLGMQSASWSWLHSGVYCAGVQQWILRVCHMAGYLLRLWTWWWHFGSNIALVFQSIQSKNFWYSHSLTTFCTMGIVSVAAKKWSMFYFLQADLSFFWRDRERRRLVGLLSSLTILWPRSLTLW